MARKSNLPKRASAELEINKQLHGNMLISEGEVRTILVEVPGEDGMWAGVHLMVRAYEDRYKKEMKGWNRQMASKRTKYGLAVEGDLKEAGFRHQVSLPMFFDKNLSTIEHPEGELDSLFYHLDRYFPQLFKEEKLIAKFCRLYPEFMVPDYL